MDANKLAALFFSSMTGWISSSIPFSTITADLMQLMKNYLLLVQNMKKCYGKRPFGTHFEQTLRIHVQKLVPHTF